MHGLLSRAAGRLKHRPTPQPEHQEAEPVLATQPDRQKISVTGTLTQVTRRPVGDVSSIEAELDDGSDALTLIWLGRRRIAGIRPGTRMTVHGRIGRKHGHRILFNPGYVLLP